jgi:UPF0716 family protein affecting phage T7 exclusion
MVYFHSLDLNDGGEGPAFFSIMFIMLIAAPLMVVPGCLSGLLALSLLQTAHRRERDADSNL